MEPLLFSPAKLPPVCTENVSCSCAAQWLPRSWKDGSCAHLRVAVHRCIQERRVPKLSYTPTTEIMTVPCRLDDHRLSSMWEHSPRHHDVKPYASFPNADIPEDRHPVGTRPLMQPSSAEQPQQRNANPGRPGRGARRAFPGGTAPRRRASNHCTAILRSHVLNDCACHATVKPLELRSIIVVEVLQEILVIR